MKEDIGCQNGFDQLDLISCENMTKPLEENRKKPNDQSLLDKQINKETDTLEPMNFPGTLLIIDTETTGLDEEKDSCIEVGAILFHVKSRSVLSQQSFLLPVEINNAENINHIPALISRLPQPFKEGIEFFKCLVDYSDVIVAHNAAFDRKWFGKDSLPDLSKPWICSMEDISWPEDKNLSGRPSVRDLALAYGIPVWNAHRALTDCIYLAEVFSRCNDLELLLSQGLEPRRLMRADVSYDQRHLAKEAGFRWNNPVSGAWTRRISEREAMKLNFPVIEVHSETY